MDRPQTRTDRRNANITGWIRNRLHRRQIQTLIEAGDMLSGLADRYDLVTDQDCLDGKLAKTDLQVERTISRDMREKAMSVYKAADMLWKIQTGVRGGGMR